MSSRVPDRRAVWEITAYCYAFGHDYKGLPSCCETCAIDSCAKMVYQDPKNRCLLEKVTEDGKTLPIPVEDYFCLEELKKNENDLLMDLDIDEGVSESWHSFPLFRPCTCKKRMINK
ncbi:hypothetical protein RvY_11571 [Ramazzottius varieornatus]|uniref:Uncharacterized protein n=1 Tax=Ramazzottius varieornatus TaxID=947166 RepID=A0A1D1VGM0_RAMVA|nr:hypothetical protein RvY_11571 [Ramazzottius varieornatus]